MIKYELNIEFKIEGVVSMTIADVADFWTDKSFLITSNLKGTKYFIPRENILYYTIKEGEKDGDN